MKKQTLMSRKMLLIAALFSLLLCPMLFFGSQYFPSSMGFLESMLCPAGMHLDRSVETVDDRVGNNDAIASYLVCTDGREQVDVSGKMLVILFGVVIIGAGLLVTWALTGSGKEAEGTRTG